MNTDKHNLITLINGDFNLSQTLNKKQKQMSFAVL